MNKDDVDVTIELLVLGASSVGKTNLIHRYVDDTFSESSRPTIGNDFFKIQKTYNGLKAYVKFWDTAGQERFQSLTNTLFFNADAVILVYDITNRESFERIKYWLAEVRINCKKPVKLMLIGNKSDLSENRQVSPDEAKLFAKQNDMLFFETSAKTNEDNCVNVAFQALIQDKADQLYQETLADNAAELEKIRKTVVRLEDGDRPKKESKGCC